MYSFCDEKIIKNDINVILQNKNPYKIRAELSNWWRIRDSNP